MLDDVYGTTLISSASRWDDESTQILPEERRTAALSTARRASGAQRAHLWQGSRTSDGKGAFGACAPSARKPHYRRQGSLRRVCTFGKEAALSTAREPPVRSAHTFGKEAFGAARLRQGQTRSRSECATLCSTSQTCPFSDPAARLPCRRTRGFPAGRLPCRRTHGSPQSLS